MQTMASHDENVVCLNNILEDKELQLQLQKCFTQKPSPSKSANELSCDVLCSTEPFSHCMIKNFLTDRHLVDSIEEAATQLEYFEKNNDLYKFQQTKALEKNKKPAIKSLRCALDKMKEWLSHLFDVKLFDKIDMFAAQYKYTDTLLCHDDELEGRRIAYIYYLVPEDWSEEDGGTLDLFAMDRESGSPTGIVKSITPVRNSLVFFEVTHKSFHQVAEVLSQYKCRLSVSGWFHGPPVPRPVVKAGTGVITASAPVDIDEESFYSWLNADYLNPVTQSEIQERFTEDSEIQLSDFISEEKYIKLCEDIKGEQIVWRQKGPAIKRNIEVAEVTSLPKSISDCIELLTSDAMFLVLSNVTGLKLHPLAANSDSEEEESVSEPKSKKAKSTSNQESESSTFDPNPQNSGACGSVSYQVHRWSHGTYTLLHDTDIEQGKDCALDAVIHFNSEEWEESQGAFTSYIAKGDDEELLTLEPRQNCLSLVYRDTDALRFVKHVNHKICRKTHPYVYDISLVYNEP